MEINREEIEYILDYRPGELSDNQWKSIVKTNQLNIDNTILSKEVLDSGYTINDLWIDSIKWPSYRGKYLTIESNISKPTIIDFNEFVNDIPNDGEIYYRPRHGFHMWFTHEGFNNYAEGMKAMIKIMDELEYKLMYRDNDNTK